MARVCVYCSTASFFVTLQGPEFGESSLDKDSENLLISLERCNTKCAMVTRPYVLRQYGTGALLFRFAVHIFSITLCSVGSVNTFPCESDDEVRIVFFTLHFNFFAGPREDPQALFCWRSSFCVVPISRFEQLLARRRPSSQSTTHHHKHSGDQTRINRRWR